MGRLWKDLNLDQLIMTSYAPYNSKYNSIEIAWGTLSQALAQTTLVKNASDFKKDKQGMINMFNQAFIELKHI